MYCTYLCYSALASEPRDYECNGLHKHSKAVSTGTLTLGLLTTVLSVVYSAVRAGSSTTLLSPPSSPRAGNSWQNLSNSCFKICNLSTLTEKNVLKLSYNYCFWFLFLEQLYLMFGYMRKF